MNLLTEPYLTQSARWPTTGRHILAQYDDSTVVVYQAYRPDIGSYAAAHGRFGGSFSLHRMSWIKPNFLWMMYPDHHPSGAPLNRRAIQLGLRGDVLKQYAAEWIVGIEDISEFVEAQSRHVAERAWESLTTPREDAYPVGDPAVAGRLMIDKWEARGGVPC